MGCGLLAPGDTLSRAGTGWLLIGSDLTVLAKLAKKSFAMDAKDSGCLTMVLMMSLQYAENVIPFEILKGVPSASLSLVLHGRCSDGLRQILRRDDGMRGQGDGSFDHMFELADIAGPRIACQQRYGLR